ncbi:MAG: mucoidy inhibitor MuiA family protein [Pseudomonadota bacterium]|nr:mucoidy inhibitor MuiA family protein [Pseudomonadota bacterium]
MKISFVAALLVSASSSLAYAQDIPAQSHIESATVYPQGADVVRVAKIELRAGENVVAFADLPANVDPQSIRVEGRGAEVFEIGSIDTRVLSDTNVASGNRKDFESQIEKLTDERAGLGGAIANYETERKLLLSIAEKAHLQTGSTTVPNSVDPAGLNTVITTVAVQLTTTSKAILDAKIRQRQIDRESAELQLKMESFAPESAQHLQTIVHVKSNSPETADFKLTYRVPNAGWHAFYDARLTSPKGVEEPHLSLVRRADVQQATGEDWNDVHLVLSTAQPAGNAAPPSLDEQQLSIVLAEAAKPASIASNTLNKKQFAAREGAQLDAGSGGEADAPAAMPDQQALEQKAKMEQAGFNATYLIEGQVSIDKNGTSKKVNIGTSDYTPKLMVESVPRLDIHAYLTASFLTDADAPLLAGPVNLFRDESYVGQVGIDEFASGEEAKLGFGVDDLVKVKRTEVKRLAAQEGLLSTSNTQAMAWNISVTNFHTSKMPIRIIDRKPFSSDAKISVTDLPGATPSSTKDLDHKRGVLAWDLNLDPKAKAEIMTGYKVTTPNDLRVGLVD